MGTILPRGHAWSAGVRPQRRRVRPVGNDLFLPPRPRSGGEGRKGQDDMAAFQVQPDPEAGAARLPVVVLVSLISMFFAAILDYSLPLYFNAMEGFPEGTWANLAAWVVAPWAVAPILAELLARRFGERRVWGAAMLGQAAVPALLAVIPKPWIVSPAA